MMSTAPQAVQEVVAAAATQVAALPPAWVTWSAALLTPAIAMLAVMVAVAQWRIARNKLKLDLFDRRNVVFAAAMGAIDTIIKGDHLTEVSFERHFSDTAPARWLFGSEVDAYVRGELRARFVSYFSVCVELQKLETQNDVWGEEYEARKQVLEGEARRLRVWSLQQRKPLVDLFADYLTVKH